MKLLIATLITSVGLMASSMVLADRGHGHGHYKQGHKHHIPHHHKPRHKHVTHHHYHVYEAAPVYARVVSAQPVYREVAVSVPVQSCGVETVQYRAANPRSAATGAIVGGVIGAAIGREFGGRHDAFMGGVTGAQLGHSIANASGRTYYEDREVCTTHYRTEYRRELAGYNVAYSYNNRMYHTEHPHHPGSSIRVDVRLH
jgi:uncharacterized protein YcfJ